MACGNPFLRRHGALTAILVSLSCSQETPPHPSEPAPAPATLSVLYVGCDEIQDGAVCEMPAHSELTIWLRHEGDVTLSVGGGTVEASSMVVVDDGTRFTVPVGALPTQVEVLAHQDGLLQQWSLSLVAAPGRDVFADGVPEGVDCQTWVAEQLLTAPAREQGDLLMVMAHCDSQAGDSAARLMHTQQALSAYRDAGQRSREIRAHSVLSFVLFGHPGELEQIPALLDNIPHTDNGSSSAGISYFKGMFSQRIGDYRSALKRLDHSLTLGRRLGVNQFRTPTEDLTASVYVDLGRFDDAESIQNEIVSELPLDADSCSDAKANSKYISALAWTLLRRAEAEGGISGDPTALLTRALKMPPDCSLAPASVANIQVNLALAAWHRGDLDQVSAYLDEAEALMPDPDPIYAQWLADLRSRVIRAGGDIPAALDAAELSVALAQLRGAPDSLSQAHANHAEVLWEAGRISEAIEAFQAAHDAIMVGTATIPLAAGREEFLTARKRITTRYVALLMEQERYADAMAVVRISRSRVLRIAQISHRIAAFDPDQRQEWEEAMARYIGLREEQLKMATDSWKLSAAESRKQEPIRQTLEASASAALDDVLATFDERSTSTALRVPAPGEVMLTWFVEGDQWVGFAATVDGVTATRIGTFPADRQALGEALFAPFATVIRQAEQVTMLPWDRLRDVDLGDLPMGGVRLQSLVPVVYSLDLAGGTPSPTGDSFLVVADPNNNLPYARQEGEQIPNASVRLVGKAASRASVLAALLEADQFHYAGHAEFREDDALGARMPMADGEILIGDILALPSVPRRVVLSACESSRSPEGPVETWGLAQAFLIAGAQEVIASSRPVDDAAGARLARALYAQDTAQPLSQRLEPALEAAGVDRGPGGSAYRVWVR